MPASFHRIAVRPAGNGCGLFRRYGNFRVVKAGHSDAKLRAAAALWMIP